jgi:hypothetical protein
MSAGVRLPDTVGRSAGVVAADVGGELVMLSLRTGEYYGLNAVGSRVWELIAEPRPVMQVRDQLLAEYPDVEAVRVTRDLLALLAELEGAGLIVAGRTVGS